MTMTAYKRKSLIGHLHTVSESGPVTIMVGSMVPGRALEQRLRAYILSTSSSGEGQAWDFETSTLLIHLQQDHIS